MGRNTDRLELIVYYYEDWLDDPQRNDLFLDLQGFTLDVKSALKTKIIGHPVFPATERELKDMGISLGPADNPVLVIRYQGKVYGWLSAPATEAAVQEAVDQALKSIGETKK